MTINRRKFISQTTCAIAGSIALARPPLFRQNVVMTVNGEIPADQLGFSLTHEHVLVDFIGADKVDPSRYDAIDVYKRALPLLLTAKEKGCKTLVECTPAYLGRDVKLLQKLSKETGLNILTNTGYYGAAKEKYLPALAYKETANQVAARWINEWTNGIEASGIRPGFIKSGVDKFPLSEVQQKMIEAAAMTHLATGLTFGVHTGDGAAAMEEMRIFDSLGVDASAWIWIHAQNEKQRELHIRAAKAGGWVSYDGVHANSISDCLDFLKDMKREQLLRRVLLSHDSGWYHVGEPGGGEYNDYNTIADKLIPVMKENGFTQSDVWQIFVNNPANAFAIRVRKK